jgi:hypothetical protein
MDEYGRCVAAALMNENWRRTGEVKGLRDPPGCAVMLSKQKRDPNFAFAIVPGRTGAHMGATWRF